MHRDGILHAVQAHQGLAYGLSRKAHPHLVCSGCNQVVDAPEPDLPTGWGAGSGFRVSGADLVGFGACPLCQQADRQLAGPRR